MARSRRTHSARACWCCRESGTRLLSRSICWHSIGSSQRGLLLGHAVHGAEAPDQIAGVDSDDLTGREQIGKNFEGYAVIGIIEDGNQHQAVCDVEIRVARGQT